MTSEAQKQRMREQGSAQLRTMTRMVLDMNGGDPRAAHYFGNRFSNKVRDALINAGIDLPERLLFMTKASVKEIVGVGKAGLEEIEAYRAKFGLSW